MTRVHDGSHSFTCHLHVYPRMELAMPAFITVHGASPHADVLLTCVVYRNHAMAIHNFYLFSVTFTRCGEKPGLK